MPDHQRYVLPVHPEDVEVVSARLWAAGALGVWEQPGALTAWFDAPSDGVPPGGAWEPEPDRDWQAEWKATIAPVRAGRFVVVPTWLADDHLADDDETTLVLDPGRAFGSGHHATTTLCLEALDRLPLDRVTVLDVGCGSGVLAIAAATRGARAIGTDIDPDAVEVTAENAARNGVTVATAVGSVAEAVALAGGPAPVVVANLVTDTVVTLADQLVAACAAGGSLIVSGIAADRTERAVDALRTGGLQVGEVVERDGWVAIVGAPAAGGAAPPSRGRDDRLDPDGAGA